MRKIDISSLQSRISELGPFSGQSQVEAAMVATLRALGEQLLDDELAWLATELPQQLAEPLTKSRRVPSGPHPTANKRAFFASVALHENVATGLATEHAEIVCQALAEAASYETIEHLKKHLPELADLFELRPTPDTPPHMPHPNSRAPTDLAEGRPGGSHPISSSDLSSLSHRHSVARSADPHGDTKLSGARGTQQEREGRTLAAGQPGARKKLSDSH